MVTRAFDAAEFLDTPKMMALYLIEALNTNDPTMITKALDTIARARELTHNTHNKGDK